MSETTVPELLVLSGKGGTGKTSLTGAFACLSAAERKTVLADCDVDAADLHLLLAPVEERSKAFRSGFEAILDPGTCIRCGACYARCRFEAVRKGPGGAGEASFSIDETACEGCGVCGIVCPVDAIRMEEAVCGAWTVSRTRAGSLIHARLLPGGENSGKLVARVREAARERAAAQNAQLILIDGPPGVGCPVIASLGGVRLALVVTEPTLSGLHDLERVLALAKHFGVACAVCVNKWDLNAELAGRIEARARAAGAVPVGRIRYDRAFSEAQRAGRVVTEAPGPLADEVCAVWQTMKGIWA